MYYSIRQILLVHFLMGIGFGVAATAYAHYRQRPRSLFIFGGDLFSFGEPRMWLRWYVLAFVFEFVTSFVPGQGAVMYLEVSLSFIEAAMIVGGAWVVDRACLLFESPVAGDRPRQIATPTLRDRLRARREAREAAAANAREETRRAFERVTRGH